MSENGSVAQKGGLGTNFEQWVQTGFLTTLIIGGSAPCIPANKVIEVAFQTTSQGHHTDDLLVKAKSSLGEHRLLIQAKTNITFSSDNPTFNKVIADFWKDFNDDEHFDKRKDRLVIVKSSINHSENNHIKVLFDWARTHATVEDFLIEVKRVKGKESRLSIFQESLKKANDGTVVSDEQLTEFLQCIDLIAYDFTHVSSTARSHFLNLIKLSKSSSTELDEESIWHDIHAHVCSLNPNGGNETTDSIQKSPLFNHFNLERLNPHFADVEKLRNNTAIVFNPVKSSIDDLHLPRNESTSSIANSIRNNQITIVTGKPGVGKTAVVKDSLSLHFSDSGVFVFRADVFNASSIGQLMTSEGILTSVKDLFACIALLPEKIIVVDSLEKLLEGDPNNAFSQLLAFAKEMPDLRIVATARGFSVDQLCIRFGMNLKEISVLHIPQLDDAEISLIETRFPPLIDALGNPKIKQLLRSPKYVDLALKALPRTRADLSTISLSGFTDALWTGLIKFSDKGNFGMSLKRESAFMNIAVDRARQMKLFVRPAEGHEEAIAHLEEDDIVFQDGDKSRFAPSHDIFEDMALVRHVSQLHDDSTSTSELVEKLGNEPAMRRAFRLWIESSLEEENASFKRFIASAIADDSIASYWKDEVLIAILRSDDSSMFFNQFEDKLLESNAQFLERCIHILRTACKENAMYGPKSFVVPVGSGWEEIIKFIAYRIGRLNNLKHSIYNLVVADWRLGFMCGKNLREEDKTHVKAIVLHFIDQIESETYSWNDDYQGDKQKQLIEVLLEIADCAESEITNLIGRAIDKNDKHWQHRNFYEIVLETCLSGLLPNAFVKAFPDLIIKVAWAEWKLKERKPNPDSITWQIDAGRLRGDECWGIEDRNDFFPPSVYKTPTYNLLMHHPAKAMKFILEFINYSVDFYVNASCDYKHKVSEIEIELNDGSLIKQYAAWELWAAYRGTGNTHYALVSMLMSLEKYMLEIAANESDVSRTNLRYIFNYMLREANNVAITGVLCSVAMAYPKEVGEEMLPLFGVVEFYDLDLTRAIQDMGSPLNMLDNEIPFAQKEQQRLHDLPHRKRFRNGIRDFLPWYQFNVGKLNPRIHDILDTLKTKVQPEDIVGNKLLAEIDIRTHKFGDYNKEIGGFMVTPTYVAPVAEHLEAHRPIFEEENKRQALALKLRNAVDFKETLSYTDWCIGYKTYADDKSLNRFIDLPLSLAVIGIRELSSELDEEQRLWCFETILYVLMEKLRSLNDPYQGFDMERSSHPLEKDLALRSIHLLFQAAINEDESKAVRFCLIHFLVAHYPNHEFGAFVQYVRDTLFESHPKEAWNGWNCMLRYAEFIAANPTKPHELELQEKFEKQKQALLLELSKTQPSTVAISVIDFKTFDAHILCRALVMCPFKSKDPFVGEFVSKVLPYIIEDLKVNDRYSYSANNRSRKLSPQVTRQAIQFLSDLMLNGEEELGKEVSKLLFNTYKGAQDSPIELAGQTEFVWDVYEFVVLKYYDHSKTVKGSLNDDEQTKRFWNQWKDLAQLITNSGTDCLLPMLFLNVSVVKGNYTMVHHPPDESDWEALEFDDGLINQWVSEFASFGIHKYILNLYSTIGNRYLPLGISDLTDLLQKHDSNGESLNTDAGVRLIKKIFYNHMSEVKKSNPLMTDLLWILDKMVDQGSSEAYLFRENVITYKVA